LFEGPPIRGIKFGQSAQKYTVGGLQSAVDPAEPFLVDLDVVRFVARLGATKYEFWQW
jgi:hypothetical protein